jgi:hypothetical protein
MRLWRRTIAPGLATLAVVLLGAADASGVDQMANIKTIKTLNPTSVTMPAVAADGQLPLRHLVLRGLAAGSLPGGYPYDEPREEKYDENYQETLHQQSTPA